MLLPFTTTRWPRGEDSRRRREETTKASAVSRVERIVFTSKLPALSQNQVPMTLGFPTGSVNIVEQILSSRTGVSPSTKRFSKWLTDLLKA